MTSVPAGHLDDFRYVEDQGLLRAVGWFLFPDGAADEIRVRTGNDERFDVERTPRPDLLAAYPHIPQADRGGFLIQLPIEKLAPGESVAIELELLRQDRVVATVPLGYRRPSQDHPVPPTELIERVSASENAEYFLATGNRHANDAVRMLARHKDPTSVSVFLDWGCGSGRVTTHLAGLLGNATACGADIDREAIEWLSRSLPEGEFHATGLGPPLPFADDRFDFILASSVFTHLTAGYQLEWMKEMVRILAPQGILMATTHGATSAAMVNEPEIHAALASTGFFDGQPDERLGEVASGDYYRATFQTVEKTRQMWGEFLREKELVEAGLNSHQDVWILQKP